MHRVVVLQRNRIYGETLAEVVRRVVPGALTTMHQYAVEALATMQSHRADIAVLGMQALDWDGLDYLPLIIDGGLATKVMVITARRDEHTLARLKSLKLDALIHASDDNLEMFGRALRAVVAGEHFIGPTFRALLELERKNNVESVLSPHERLILSALGEGLDNEEAALRLKLNAETVRSHRDHIMRKLKLHHKGDLMCYAARRGYVRFTPEGVRHPGFERAFEQLGNGDGRQTPNPRPNE